jgi:predicted GIY-YIG superfamily endonuclease/predicted DNA-binding protein YlxM (UPF0122 family)
MRPKYSKDHATRKRKKFLNSKDEMKIIKEYNGGLSIRKLSSRYSVSKSAISSVLKRRNVKCRINNSHIKLWKKINDVEQIDKNICGIYGLYFINKNDHNDIKLYIGGSTNIKARLKEHMKYLGSNKHFSKNMQKYFNNNNYKLNLAIIKKCDENSVMQEERVAQHDYNRSCLLNTWLSCDENDLLPYLNKAITLKSYKNYTVTDNGCWECKCVHKSGYSRLSVVAHKDWGPGTKKYLYVHRVAYWEKYGKYPELVRHKCNNSKCRNPDHLTEGNHKDNAIDKRGDFPKVFEQKWLEYSADVMKLTKYFGWKGNCRVKNELVSISVYAWEKKLHLRDKYREVLASNQDRKI